jgi:hypothetical protein
LDQYITSYVCLSDVVFYILTKFCIFWTSDLSAVKKWKRFPTVDWLFGCYFRENSGAGCKSDLYVICVLRQWTCICISFALFEIYLYWSCGHEEFFLFVEIVYLLNIVMLFISLRRCHGINNLTMNYYFLMLSYLPCQINA